ncbi:hypothetical protein [uncultured Sphingomonas sp.]|uniref:hypothetical protein n=1 Tax=uncultured Sphingomonas sp. TaxID=158754 RepID=UPI0025D7EF20|nr:hypothetical protein [uncultured Sphingomonas sp.]
MGSTRPRIIATGFIADQPEEATVFPSAGRNSAAPSFQALYWRCIAMAMYSVRLSNPDMRPMLFSNVRPPIVDGVDLEAVFGRLGVEVVRLPLTHRLPVGRVRSWGSVFYFLDILHCLSEREPNAQLALIDSDVLVLGDLTGMFAATLGGYGGYAIDTLPDEDFNGLSRTQMTSIAIEDAAAIGGPPNVDCVIHRGGELFVADMTKVASDLPRLDAIWRAIHAGQGALGRITTEEHFWSVYFASAARPMVELAAYVKRIWTSWRFFTAEPGDEKLAIWHLPAEKRYGLKDLFRWAARHDFDLDMPVDQFRARAARLCGLPRISVAKRLRDAPRWIRYRF